jgi:hypothetical protein
MYLFAIFFPDILQKDDTNVPGCNNHEEPAEIPDSIEGIFLFCHCTTVKLSYSRLGRT